MSVIYNHVQMGSVDKDGNVNIMYPITTAEDVVIKNVNGNLPENVSNIQELSETLGDMAFEQGEALVYIGEEETVDLELSNSEIDDRHVSSVTTYSSKKIRELLQMMKGEILTEIKGI